MSAPLIAVTMGDLAGVGPEIIAKTFAEPDFTKRNRAVVVGDVAILNRAAELLDVKLEVNAVTSPGEGRFEPGVVDVIPGSELPEDLPFGKLDARAGAAAYEYVRLATELARKGEVAAICTAPLNKEAMHKGGYVYPGHTEILAELTDTKDYAMMLVAEGDAENGALRVIHVSTHVSLQEAIKRAKPDRELAVIRLAHSALVRLGIEEPKIAVAGLNPHAGENGLFGDEDAENIRPAVERAVEEGLEVSGPWPADTVFSRARNGDFDMVVVQYHDQGHIPIKLMGFESGVNVTVGLPFFRTSVDHGTAFDIAGTGKADHVSLKTALDLARELAAPQEERS